MSDQEDEPRRDDDGHAADAAGRGADSGCRDAEFVGHGADDHGGGRDAEDPDLFEAFRELRAEDGEATPPFDPVWEAVLDRRRSRRRRFGAGLAAAATLVLAAGLGLWTVLGGSTTGPNPGRGDEVVGYLADGVTGGLDGWSSPTDELATGRFATGSLDRPGAARAPGSDRARGDFEAGEPAPDARLPGRRDRGTRIDEWVAPTADLVDPDVTNSRREP